MPHPNSLKTMCDSKLKSCSGPSRRLASLWNLVFSYGATALVLTRTLLFVPWYLEFIPFKEYGAWVATGGAISFLTIIDFGLTGVLTQQAAAACGSRDYQRLGHVVGTGLGICAVLACAAGLLAAALSPFIPAMVAADGTMARRLTACILIAALSNSLNIIGFAAGGVLKSLQRSFLPGILLTVSEGVNLLAVVVCLLKGLGLYSIAIGLLSRSVVLTVGNMSGVYWACSRQLGLALRWASDEARSLWRLSVHVFAGRAGSALAASTDPFFIGVLMGPEAAGVFSLTTRAHDLVRSLASRLSEALMPSMAHLHGEGNTARFAEVFVLALKIQTTIAAIGLAGVMAFNRSFVSLWVGPHFFGGQALSMTFGLWCIGYMVGGVVWQTLYAMGEMIKLSQIVWLETGVKIIAALILISVFGIVGAPLAALVSQAVCFMLLIPLIVRRIHSLRSQSASLLVNIGVRLTVPPALASLVILFSGFSETWPRFIMVSGMYLFVVLCVSSIVDRRVIEGLLPSQRGKRSINTVSAS